MASTGPQYLERRVARLDLALAHIRQHEPGELIHEVYRSACIREFETIVRESVRLLRRHLRQYFGSNHRADSLTYRDVFRYAARHGVISIKECERWFGYRDHLERASYHMDEDFTETTLFMLKQLGDDVRNLSGRVSAETADG